MCSKLSWARCLLLFFVIFLTSYWLFNAVPFQSLKDKHILKRGEYGPFSTDVKTLLFPSIHTSYSPPNYMQMKIKLRGLFHFERWHNFNTCKIYEYLYLFFNIYAFYLLQIGTIYQHILLQGIVPSIEHELLFCFYTLSIIIHIWVYFFFLENIAQMHSNPC